MARRLNIGLYQGPPTLVAQTGKYGILHPQVRFTKAGSGPGATKDPRGFWVAINPAWETFNDSGSFSYTGGTGQITGNYSAGALPGGQTGLQNYSGSPLVINATSPVVNFSGATFTSAPSSSATSAILNTVWLPPSGAYVVNFTETAGGATETRSVTFTKGASTATWSGGLSANCNALISIPSLVTRATRGASFRYAWSDLEPTTANNYVYTRMDADLAQCIARGCMWVPILITKTFTIGEGNPAPTYLASINSVTSRNANGDPASYCMWRWNSTFKTRFAALIAAIGARYDAVANFGGIATQETAVPALPAGTGYLDTTYLANLKSESDEVVAACPTSWHFAYQNFIQNSQFGINYGDWLVDQYAAYIQTNNAILFGPDGVTGGSVVTRCYPRQLPYHNIAGGTVNRTAQAGWPGGSTSFAGGGGTGLAFQQAEWTSGPPAQPNTPVASAFTYITSGATTDIDVCMMDWHQTPGTPNGPNGTSGQTFSNGGIQLIAANPYPFNPIWTP